MPKAITQNIERATQRAIIKGLGFNDTEIGKELIGIFTAFSGFFDGQTKLIDRIKDGVLANGGIPIVLPITAFEDAMSIGVNGNCFALPSRELTADTVEALLASYHLDAAVFVSSSDIATSGMLMGAIRSNIPSIFVGVGTFNDALSITQLFEAVGAVKSGKRNVLSLNELENDGITTNELNHMPFAIEALGLSLRANSTILKNSAQRLRLAYESGAMAVTLSRDQIVPRMILNKASFTNALALVSAIGTSTNVVLHLLAAANECGMEINADQLEFITSKAPLIVEQKTTIKEFDKAGGVMAALKQLLPVEGQKKKPLIDTSVKVVGANSLCDILNEVEVDEEIIKSTTDAINQNGAISVLNGNLAEDGALMNTIACGGSISFAGKAKVFNSEEEAIAAISGGSIVRGDCLVLRYCGAKTQGMRDAMPIATALTALGLGSDVGLVTEGRLSGVYPFATAVHVCPEATDGGTIALVVDGDKIVIDSAKQKLSLEVNNKELTTRRKKWKPELTHLNSFLLRYSATITPASKGAVYKNKF